jgi:hypothetical protein
MTTNNKPGCLTAILQSLGLAPQRTGSIEEPREEETLPYRISDDFLSPPELNFYRVLCAAAADWAVICPKVSLGDLFYSKSGDHGANISYMNRIKQKHVDFLLCDPKSMRPVIGIELDDASHQRPDRQERDSFVERVFETAELPLLRLSTQASYNVRALAAELKDKANMANLEAEAPGLQRKPQAELPAQAGVSAPPVGAGSAVPHPASQAASPPACPKCSRPMVLRTVQKDGPHKGKKFWGCPDFPHCRGVREHVPEGGS